MILNVDFKIEFLRACGIQSVPHCPVCLCFNCPETSEATEGDGESLEPEKSLEPDKSEIFYLILQLIFSKDVLAKRKLPSSFLGELGEFTHGFMYTTDSIQVTFELYSLYFLDSDFLGPLLLPIYQTQLLIGD